MSDLQTKSEQYLADIATIEELRISKVEAESKLAELEVSTDLTIEDPAEQMANARKVIDNSDFKTRGINQRIDSGRAELVELIVSAERDFASEEVRVIRAKLEKAKKIINSKSFQRSMEELKALRVIGGYFAWDDVIQAAIPASCGPDESRELAEKMDLLTPDAPVPDDLTFARKAINYTRSDHNYAGGDGLFRDTTRLGL